MAKAKTKTTKKPQSKPKAAKERIYTAEELAEIEKEYQIAKWWLDLKETNNETFMPLFEDQSRYLVLMGGGGSGKSIFAGRKVLERVTSEPNHRFLVMRKVKASIKDSCSEQLKKQLEEHYPSVVYEENLTDLTLKFKNGSEIIFKGADNMEKIKSISGISSVWIEEASELTLKDFLQLDTRLRDETGHYKQFIISFNPVSVTHWLKSRFFDTKDERATTHKSTYKDNRFLDDEYIRTLEEFKNHDEYYYNVYALGMWGVTGKTVFPAALVSERLSRIPKPIRVMYFLYSYDGLTIKDIRAEDDENGIIQVFKEPESGVPYVIAGDTAGEGSDSFVAQVLDNRTGEQVAVLRHKDGEDLFTRQIYALGMWYNTALIAIESNFSTYPVMELQRLGYPNLYVREVFDSYTKKHKKAFGFRTDKASRNVIIANLISVVREQIDTINDRTTLEEMLTFVRNDDFRPEAEEGAHDDCVMSLAIAHYIRPQQRMHKLEGEAEKKKWSKDMWEDYRNASKEGKKYLIEKWGKPQ